MIVSGELSTIAGIGFIASSDMDASPSKPARATRHVLTSTPT
jgi:hypothetical protein